MKILVIDDEGVILGMIVKMLSGEGYLEIQGPTVLIEYQALGGNHVHSLWRDPERDFGRDLLLEHLENDHAIP